MKGALYSQVFLHYSAFFQLQCLSYLFMFLKHCTKTVNYPQYNSLFSSFAAINNVRHKCPLSLFLFNLSYIVMDSMQGTDMKILPALRFIDIDNCNDVVWLFDNSSAAQARFTQASWNFFLWSVICALKVQSATLRPCELWVCKQFVRTKLY